MKPDTSIAAITGHKLGSISQILDFYMLIDTELAEAAVAKRLAYEQERK